MKKILLVTIMSLGIANISYAGFFDNKCTPVEKIEQKIKYIVAEDELLRQEAMADRSKFQANAKKAKEMAKLLPDLKKQYVKECEVLINDCKACEEYKKSKERGAALDKASKESGARVLKMLDN